GGTAWMPAPWRRRPSTSPPGSTAPGWLACRLRRSCYGCTRRGRTRARSLGEFRRHRRPAWRRPDFGRPGGGLRLAAMVFSVITTDLLRHAQRNGRDQEAGPALALALLGGDREGFLLALGRVARYLARGQRVARVAQRDRRREDHAVDPAAGGQQRAAGVPRPHQRPDRVDLPLDL